jgi:hypothetical protein
MKKIGLALALVTALALPGTAFAQRPEGKGKRHHAAGCAVHVSKRGKLDRCELKRQVRRAAVRQCREERAQDLAAFEEKYGAEGGMRNCVRQAVQDLITEFKNAAKACKAEAKEDPDAFLVKYGSNHNKRNAFGKCVSRHVREGDQGGRGDDPGDSEGDDDGDSEGGDDQPGQDEAPGQDDNEEDPGQPDQDGGDV